jgi:hypothetical protein
MDDVTDKNLFAYCDNNPVMRADYDGEFWQLAGVTINSTNSGIGFSWGTIGASVLTSLSMITPVGWAVIIGSVVVVGVGYRVSKMSKGGKQRIKHSELEEVSNDEISRRLKDPSSSNSEKQKLRKEQKARGDRNKQKRGKVK